MLETFAWVSGYSLNYNFSVTIPLLETISLDIKIKMKKTIINYSSETGPCVRSCKVIQDKCGTRKSFEQWFVGFTDGDGTFNVYTSVKSNKINLTFKISQKAVNKQVLHYMKKELGVGKVSKVYNGMVSYSIRDRKSIMKVIIPLFDSNSLHTLKYNDYIKFKKALEIWVDDSKSQDVKIKLINGIERGELIRESKVSEDWIVGFIEAEGSFYLSKKGEGIIAHGFGITQKYDKHLLEQIKVFFTIKSKVRWNKGGHWALDAGDQNSLKRIKNFFFRRFKGRISLIYRIWGRSFRDKGKYSKLLVIKNHIKKLR